MPAPAPDLVTLRARTERWFVRQGLPHLIDGYNAREDILTRTAPFLTLVFVLELLFALDVEFAWWQNVLAAAASVVVVVAAVVVANRARGRRPLALPDDVGWPEVAVFVLVPPLLPLLISRDGGQALGLLAANVVLLVVAYFVTSYGVVPTSWWAARQIRRQVTSLGTLLARSLPLLLLVTMFMFFNAELWKVVDDLPPGFLAVALAILVVTGSAFVLLLLGSEIEGSARFARWSEVGGQLGGTPVDGVDLTTLAEPPPELALPRRAHTNIAVLLFASQATQILLVTAAIVAFYVLFGAFTVIDTTIEQWTGSAAITVWWRVELFGSEVAVTSELVRTSLFVGAIAGLQFTVVALTDQSYRERLASDVRAGIRRTLAVREVYEVLLAGSTDGAGSDGRGAGAAV
jgi:hypothetical protein